MIARPTAALSVLIAAASVAAAGELDLFQAAIEEFSSHNRLAIEYLRAERNDLAADEMERMREAWGALTGRFGSKPPPDLRGNPLYLSTMVDVQTRLIGALLVLKMSRPDVARASLLAVRRELSDLRRASHVEVLADCILDANAAMDRLPGAGDRPPDLDSPAASAELTASADAYGAVIRRCDGMAGPEIRRASEFRRLVDGIAASLTQVPDAIRARDRDRLHRLLIDLHSYDHLLTQRYG